MNDNKIFYIFCFTLLSTIVSESFAARRNHHKKGYKNEEQTSSPEECARTCQKNEPPKICYYHFTLELYTVLGGACQICKSNSTDSLSSNCQCIEADGIERGGILTANRMLPGPSIQVCEGDHVVVDVKNAMQGLEVTIHWHGIHQRGSQYYDGIPFVTQCPIHQGNTFRYQWNAENAGTHFWHAHTGLQKADGLYGSIIIRQPKSEDLSAYAYDFDLPSHVMFLSDWSHESAIETFPGRLHRNPGQPPDSVLINGKGQYEDGTTGHITNTSLEIFTVAQGKKYRFRMINSCATVCPVELKIEDHTLTVIASDGQPVEPTLVNTIISFSGERYDFVIEADQPVGAYWIHVRGLGECDQTKVQQHAVLKYGGSSSEPDSLKPQYDTGLPTGTVLSPLEGDCSQDVENAVCVNQLRNARNVDKDILKKNPDVKIFLPFRFFYYDDLKQLFTPNTYNHYLVAFTGEHLISVIDEISFSFPPSPPLSQIDDIPPEQFCNGDNRPPNCGQNCTCTHKIDIPLNAVVEIILLDEVKEPDLSHPFHLHGYAFNVIGLGTLSDTNLTHVLDLDKRGQLCKNFNLPPGKDTVAVPNGGYVILRFKANNPGYWFFHCHFLVHIHIGMNVILQVGTHDDLPPVPQDFPQCKNFIPPIRRQKQ